MSTNIFSAKEAKNNFGRLLDEARRMPVTIEKNGRKVAVLISSEEYAGLEAQSDAYWGHLAMEAEREGFIGVKTSKKYIDSVLNAQN